MVTRSVEAAAHEVQALSPQDLALPWLEAPLRQTLAQHRGHALLVCGQAGAGALEFVLRLAQAWLCEAVQPKQAGHPGGAPGGVDWRAQGSPAACGHCGSCRLFLSHAHPDFRLRVPQTLAVRRGFPVRLEEGRKPSRQIRIDEVRQAIDWMATTSGRGQGKVLALHPAEALNPAAASALLKTLEEPPAGARLILSTPDPGLLLPTVVSRCQMLRLAPPARELAQQWLARQGLVEQADVLLDGAGAMPLTALQWSREGVTAAAWLSLPQAVAAGDASPFAGWPIPRVVDALQKLCHDAGCRWAGGQPRFFPSALWPDGMSARRLVQWYKSLQRVMQHAEHPWNEPLLIESMVSEGRSVWEPSARRAGKG